jgi:hypothetical protein
MPRDGILIVGLGILPLFSVVICNVERRFCAFVDLIGFDAFSDGFWIRLMDEY